MKDRQHRKRKYCKVNSWEKLRKWLKAGELKWETENLTCAAQEQALRTKAIKNGTGLQDAGSMQALQSESWRCHPYCQFVFCPSWKPIQEETQQNQRKTSLAPVQEIEIKYEDKWFSHQPEPVLQNNKCKILWEFAIQTDKEIEHQSPDILAIDKEIIECKIIAIAVPGDQNIEK